MPARYFISIALALLIVISSTTLLSAQGKFSGRVSDAQGEPMFGVVVVDTNNYSIIGQTDFDGMFSIAIPDGKPHIFKLSLLGYEELVETITVTAGAPINKEYTLFEKSLLSNEVKIEAKAVRSSDTYMEKIKMNSTTSLDYISSATIKKTGDSNVLNAVARVSGVSTSGGLITVRGIGDRYVKTMLNGSRIPTLDPLTNNIKLDIFPASLVDNIVITKTASPDLPGDWSGAYISVETKDYPDKLTVNIESQFGYNPQFTFQDFVTSDRSTTDWLGFDNGLRTRTGNDIVEPNLNPSTYQELVALGLGDYYNSMGVNGWTDGNALADTYFRLGLVELGLLPAALMNDQTAYQEALAAYNANYKPQAYRNINPNNTDYNNGFSNNWTTKFRKAPLSFSQNASFGDQRTLFGRPLGFFVGIRYGNTYRYDPNGISQRILNEEQGYRVETSDQTLMSRETHSWSGLLNLAYKLNDNNKLSLLFMPNIIGNNDVAAFTNVPRVENGVVLDEELTARRNIFYEQRKQLIYQFSSSHFIPSKKIKIESSASYTDGASVAPDFRTTEYSFFRQDPNSIGFYPTVGDGIRRFYRYLDEDIFDARLSAEIPLSNKTGRESNKLKIGGSTLYNYRKIDNEEYRVMLGNGAVPVLQSTDIDGYMLDRFTMTDSLIDFYYISLDEDRNHSFGHSRVDAAFAMITYDVTQSLKFSGGVRAEHTDIFTDVDKFFQEGYVRDDPRRSNVTNFPNVNAVDINEWHVLPSGSLIYKIESEKLERVNVRLNYSKSLARPSIRELNDAAILDNEFRQFIYGNSDLKIAEVTNYDLRLESYFKNGDNVSASLFYKDFTNHIEMGFGNVGITWENVPESSVIGVELEGKKDIGDHLEFRGNLTWVKSESQFVRKDFSIVDGRKFYLPIDTIYRPMFGQAPYLVNAMLSYKADSIGLTATLSYNVQGERLVITGAFKGWADVYELPRHLLDFKVSKKLGERMTASVTVRDILNAPVLRAYNLPSGWFDFDRFRYGTTYLLSIGYKL
jgi:outer membrane receptor protein involved in Fe transport